MSNQRFWEEPVQRYIDECLQGKEGPREKNFNMRWIASLVADVYRILTRGGVFLYPYDLRDPNKPNKLRIMYEAQSDRFCSSEQAAAPCSTNTSTSSTSNQPLSSACTGHFGVEK